MFVDACAIIVLLSDEAEAERVSEALVSAERPMTSAVAVLEAALGLARPDKFYLPAAAVEALILEFLDERGIEIWDLPPAMEASRLALSATHRYREDAMGSTSATACTTPAPNSPGCRSWRPPKSSARPISTPYLRALSDPIESIGSKGL
jgi:ribonuclease VapC